MRYEIGDKVKIIDGTNSKIMTISSISSDNRTYKMKEDSRNIEWSDIDGYAYNHDGCTGCYYQDKKEDEMPCVKCKQCYVTPNDQEDRWTELPLHEYDDNVLISDYIDEMILLFGKDNTINYLRYKVFENRFLFERTGNTKLMEDTEYILNILRKELN